MKMLSQINQDDKDSLNRYKDLLRHRLRKYGYRLSSYSFHKVGKKNIRRDHKHIQRGFEIKEIISGKIVAGKNHSLSLKQVEKFWLEEYNRREAEKYREQKERSRERANKWLEKLRMEMGWV